MRYAFLVPLLILALSVPAAPQTRPVAFEVASVRKSPERRPFAISPYGGNQFSINGASLTLLISVAFDMSDTDLIGGPSWRDSEYYDVVGKAEDGVVLTSDQVRPRLQQLLAERFRLVTHREPRRVSGHALLVARDGTKLKPVEGELTGGYRLDLDFAVDPAAASLEPRTVEVQKLVIDAAERPSEN